MARVAIVTHQRRRDALELAELAGAWLHERGHEVVVPDTDETAPALERCQVPLAQLAKDVDLALSLGGDGTILRTVDLVAPAGTPVLGVNVGNLGYLTETDPAGLTTSLERFFGGEFTIEERMILEVRVEMAAAPNGLVYYSLNEAVLERADASVTVRIRVTVNGEPFTTYAADGMIVATPTGSTAYNLSARGPIVSPRHRAMILTPVSPHMLFDRSLVLDEHEVLRLEVVQGRPAVLSVDGRANLATLHTGDAVVCRGADHSARLVTFGRRDFHRILKTKFGLADR